MGARITPRAGGLSAALQADLDNAKEAGYSLKAVAAEMGKSYSWAAEMVRGEQPFPLAKLDVWARLTGGQNVARWVADACGYDLVHRKDIDVETTALEAMGESAQALQVASNALSDGTVSAEEVVCYEREMLDAVEKFHGLHRALKARLKPHRQNDAARSMAEADARGREKA